MIVLSVSAAKETGCIKMQMLPPDLELRTLKRTHGQIWLQIFLFAAMVVSLGVMMALKFTFVPGGLQEVHTHPLAPWCLLVIGVASGLAFLRIRLGLRRVWGTPGR